LIQLDSLVTPEVRATVKLPTHRRDFNVVIAGDDGTIWIDLDTPDGIPHRWIELDRHGALVGQVTLPTGAKPKVGFVDALWGMANGPNYRDEVVGFRIVKL